MNNAALRLLLCLVALALFLTGCGSGSNPAAPKALTAFSLNGITGSIHETNKTITVTMSFGSDVRSLIADFHSSGTSTMVGAIARVSGAVANDFTLPVTYVVTAFDDTTASYLATVAVAASSVNAITAFALSGVAGIIDESNRNITVTVPFGSSVTALVATCSTTGIGVKVGVGSQLSGFSSNNFSRPVLYTVTAADGSSVDYNVMVALAPSSAKAITAFTLAGVTGVIGGSNESITVTMPFDTSTNALSSMVATFTTTGVGVRVGTTAVHANGLLYTFGMRHPMFFPPGLKFDAATGNEAGSFDAGPLPAVSSGVALCLYIGSLNGCDVNSDRLLWSFAGDGALVTKPIVVNQVAVIGSNTGNIYAVDAATGAQIWTGYAGNGVDSFFGRSGIGVGEEYLVVPATNRLSARKIGGP